MQIGMSSLMQEKLCVPIVSKFLQGPNVYRLKLIKNKKKLNFQKNVGNISEVRDLRLDFVRQTPFPPQTQNLFGNRLGFVSVVGN